MSFFDTLWQWGQCMIILVNKISDRDCFNLQIAFLFNIFFNSYFQSMQVSKRTIKHKIIPWMFVHTFLFLCFTFLKFDFQRLRLKHRFRPIIPRDHFLLLNSSLCSIGSHLHVWVQKAGFLYFFQVWDFCISFIRPYNIFGLAEIQILSYSPF